MNLELRDTIRIIDAELLLKIGQEAELLNTNKYRGISLNNVFDEITADVVKSIVKEKVARCTFRRNQNGFSITVPFPEEFSTMRNFVRTMRRFRNQPELSIFMNKINNPTNAFATRCIRIESRLDRFVFYIYNARSSFYDEATVYEAAFEIVYFLDMLAELYQEFGSIQERYREALEEEERQIREEEERRRRQEEERHRREEEERRRREEEERRLREENEQRQQLLRLGATQRGIDIGRRLMEMLRNT